MNNDRDARILAAYEKIGMGESARRAMAAGGELPDIRLLSDMEEFKQPRPGLLSRLLLFWRRG